ncbi:glycoside hydrolase domain-containing protein [Micromonospora sp. A200]|uniref:glycoside hydrolase domain-containing protein n=1 Tax=Micromonospora sp. A200 TaxID=2940568 RepID=UPI0024730821|nr:glycoside hydrolase domain-containing protein [Micromonospora sp. A200]
MDNIHLPRSARRLSCALLAGVVTLLALAGAAPASGRTAAPATAAPATAGRTTAAAVTGPSPGTFTGLGFDACTAPSSATMQAWLAASPYRAIIIYFGGVNRACAQPNLTPSWVAAQQAAGWHLVPIYLGLQAPCTTSTKRYLIDAANAAAQGRTQADDAVAQAKTLGLAPESVLIFDMEAYRTDDAACRSAVLAFMSAWTARLHDLGYLSGFYSSMASGVADQVAAYNTPGYVRPDYLDFARWDGVATVSDPAIPSSYWSPQRRMKQYRGDHNETWGGVTINIDNDYLDVAPIPATPFGDFNGNGWSDLLSRQPSTGNLYLYPGNGTSLGIRTTIGTGWNGMDVIVRTDFTGDGHGDLVGRDKATGYLWLYPHTPAGWGSRIRLGTGWNSMREITPAKDFNRDGYRDVLAVQASTGYLYLYPGRGTSFGPRTSLGTGWNTMDELTGIGDFNRDGYQDLLARQKSTGNLFLYPGRAGGLGTKLQVGTAWNSMRDLVGVGDFNRDGYPDLLTIEKSTSYLYFYRGQGTSFAARIRLGVSWGGMQPLL